MSVTRLIALDDAPALAKLLQALLPNVRSQRVLERNGFIRYGMAPKYLKMAGRWQHHVLYRLLNPGSG